MTKTLLDHLGIDTSLSQCRRVTMPQPVKFAVLEAVALLKPAPLLGDGVRSERFAVLLVDDITVIMEPRSVPLTVPVILCSGPA